MTEEVAIKEQEVFLAFDRLDDDQIIQEMKGAALREYVYQFEEGGRKVQGLSKAGTDDAARIMAVKYGEVLRELDVVLEFQDEHAGYFKGTVSRFAIRSDGTEVELDRAIGQKRQPKIIPGTTKPNLFWYEQGGQKALRNAKQKLIPETIKQAIIAAYIEQGKVRTLKAAEVKANEPPKPTAPAKSAEHTPPAPATTPTSSTAWERYHILYERAAQAGLKLTPLPDKAKEEIVNRTCQSIEKWLEQQTTKTDMAEKPTPTD